MTASKAIATPEKEWWQLRRRFEDNMPRALAERLLRACLSYPIMEARGCNEDHSYLPDIETPEFLRARIAAWCRRTSTPESMTTEALSQALSQAEDEALSGAEFKDYQGERQLREQAYQLAREELCGDGRLQTRCGAFSSLLNTWRETNAKVEFELLVLAVETARHEHAQSEGDRGALDLRRRSIQRRDRILKRLRADLDQLRDWYLGGDLNSLRARMPMPQVSFEETVRDGQLTIAPTLVVEIETLRSLMERDELLTVQPLTRAHRGGRRARPWRRQLEADLERAKVPLKDLSSVISFVALPKLSDRSSRQ